MEKNQLTIRDLMVEYLVYKTKYGYEPSFTREEFSEFMNYFIKYYYKGEDIPFDINKDGILFPNIEITKEGITSITNDLSKNDMEILNTSFMQRKDKDKMYFIISTFLAGLSKRQIDIKLNVKENDLLLGKYVAANIILTICDSHLKEDYYDINSCCLNKSITNNSLKGHLSSFYHIASKKVAILNKNTKNLKISNNDDYYLPYSNCLLIMNNFKFLSKLIDQEFFIDINKNSFLINNQKEHPIYNPKAKGLVKLLNGKNK